MNQTAHHEQYMNKPTLASSQSNLLFSALYKLVARWPYLLRCSRTRGAGGSGGRVGGRGAGRRRRGRRGCRAVACSELHRRVGRPAAGRGRGDEDSRGRKRKRAAAGVCVRVVRAVRGCCALVLLGWDYVSALMGWANTYNFFLYQKFLGIPWCIPCRRH